MESKREKGRKPKALPAGQVVATLNMFHVDGMDFGTYLTDAQISRGLLVFFNDARYCHPDMLDWLRVVGDMAQNLITTSDRVPDRIIMPHQHPPFPRCDKIHDSVIICFGSDIKIPKGRMPRTMPVFEPALASPVETPQEVTANAINEQLLNVIEKVMAEEVGNLKPTEEVIDLQKGTTSTVRDDRERKSVEDTVFSPVSINPQQDNRSTNNVQIPVNIQQTLINGETEMRCDVRGDLTAVQLQVNQQPNPNWIPVTLTVAKPNPPLRPVMKSILPKELQPKEKLAAAETLQSLANEIRVNKKGKRKSPLQPRIMNMETDIQIIQEVPSNTVPAKRSRKKKKANSGASEKTKEALKEHVLARQKAAASVPEVSQDKVKLDVLVFDAARCVPVHMRKQYRSLCGKRNGDISDEDADVNIVDYSTDTCTEDDMQVYEAAEGKNWEKIVQVAKEAEKVGDVLFPDDNKETEMVTVKGGQSLQETCGKEDSLAEIGMSVSVPKVPASDVNSTNCELTLCEKTGAVLNGSGKIPEGKDDASHLAVWEAELQKETPTFGLVRPRVYDPVLASAAGDLPIAPSADDMNPGTPKQILDLNNVEFGDSNLLSGISLSPYLASLGHSQTSTELSEVDNLFSSFSELLEGPLDEGAVNNAIMSFPTVDDEEFKHLAAADQLRHHIAHPETVMNIENSSDELIVDGPEEHGNVASLLKKPDISCVDECNPMDDKPKVNSKEIRKAVSPRKCDSPVEGLLQRLLKEPHVIKFPTGNSTGGTIQITFGSSGKNEVPNVVSLGDNVGNDDTEISSSNNTVSAQDLQDFQEAINKVEEEYRLQGNRATQEALNGSTCAQEFGTGAPLCKMNKLKITDIMSSPDDIMPLQAMQEKGNQHVQEGHKGKVYKRAESESQVATKGLKGLHRAQELNCDSANLNRKVLHPIIAPTSSSSKCLYPTEKDYREAEDFNTIAVPIEDTASTGFASSEALADCDYAAGNLRHFRIAMPLACKQYRLEKQPELASLLFDPRDDGFDSYTDPSNFFEHDQRVCENFAQIHFNATMRRVNLLKDLPSTGDIVQLTGKMPGHLHVQHKYEDYLLHGKHTMELRANYGEAVRMHMSPYDFEMSAKDTILTACIDMEERHLLERLVKLVMTCKELPDPMVFDDCANLMRDLHATLIGNFVQGYLLMTNRSNKLSRTRYNFILHCCIKAIVNKVPDGILKYNMNARTITRTSVMEAIQGSMDVKSKKKSTKKTANKKNENNERNTTTDGHTTGTKSGEDWSFSHVKRTGRKPKLTLAPSEVPAKTQSRKLDVDKKETKAKVKPVVVESDNDELDDIPSVTEPKPRRRGKGKKTLQREAEEMERASHERSNKNKPLQVIEEEVAQSTSEGEQNIDMEEDLRNQSVEMSEEELTYNPPKEKKLTKKRQIKKNVKSDNESETEDESMEMVFESAVKTQKKQRAMNGPKGKPNNCSPVQKKKGLTQKESNSRTSIAGSKKRTISKSEGTELVGRMRKKKKACKGCCGHDSEEDTKSEADFSTKNAAVKRRQEVQESPEEQTELLSESLYSSESEEKAVTPPAVKKRKENKKSTSSRSKKQLTNERKINMSGDESTLDGIDVMMASASLYEDNKNQGKKSQKNRKRRSLQVDHEDQEEETYSEEIFEEQEPSSPRYLKFLDTAKSGRGQKDTWNDDERHGFLDLYAVETSREKSHTYRWCVFAEKMFNTFEISKTNIQCRNQEKILRGRYHRLTKTTGAPGDLSDMDRRVMEVFSAAKHVKPDHIGSSSSRRLTSAASTVSKVRGKRQAPSKSTHNAVARKKKKKGVGRPEESDHADEASENTSDEEVPYVPSLESGKSKDRVVDVLRDHSGKSLEMQGKLLAKFDNVVTNMSQGRKKKSDPSHSSRRQEH